MVDVIATYAHTLVQKSLNFRSVSTDRTWLENPLLAGIISRIKTASLPLAEKKDLVVTVWNMFKTTSQEGTGITAEILKKIYAVIDMLEFAQHYTLKPQDRQIHSKEIDLLLEHLSHQDAQAGSEIMNASGNGDRLEAVDIIA